MAEWCRATLDQRCGGCGASIPAGAPMLVLQPRGIKRRLTRCDKCAGPAPPDLPERIVSGPPPLIPFERLGLLPLDFKRRQAREPGCDD